MHLLFKGQNKSSIVKVFLFLCLLNFSEEVKVTRIEVPPYALLGSPVTLKCHFRLEGEKLYSLNWWKDGRQFYQFIPKKEPKMVVFEIAGVKIDMEDSNLNEVHLKKIDSKSEGEYKCEVVADAPYFNTYIMASNLSIIDPPDGPPVIRGQKSIYHPGEIIHLNCTSYRSRPKSHLKWEVYQMLEESNFLHNWKQDLFKNSNDKHYRPGDRTVHNGDNARDKSHDILLNWRQNPLLSPNRMNKTLRPTIEERHLAHGDKRKRRHQHLRRKKSMKEYFSMTRKDNKSIYNEIYGRYLINHNTIKTKDEVGKVIITSSMELQLPVALRDAHSGYLKLRCSAHIKSHVWATEVTISLADVPLTDPQQLPTLHGKESRRGCGTIMSTPGFLIIASYIINR